MESSMSTGGGNLGLFGEWRDMKSQDGSSNRSLARSKTISLTMQYRLGAGLEPNGRRLPILAILSIMDICLKAMRG